MSRQARWIYRDMMDVYYDKEKPLPLDIEKLCNLIGVETEEERKIVERILSFKFEKKEDGFHHERCDEEIAEYHKKAAQAKANGKLGGRPSKPKANQNKPSGFQSGSNQDAIGNQEETRLEANQEPITNSRGNANATRLPADWHPSDDDANFCNFERPDLSIEETAARFRDYWVAQPGSKGRKLDWPATWRNWVRNEKAGGGGTPKNSMGRGLSL